jgi:hypothetical protein
MHRTALRSTYFRTVLAFHYILHMLAMQVTDEGPVLMPVTTDTWATKHNTSGLHHNLSQPTNGLTHHQIRQKCIQ